MGKHFQYGVVFDAGSSGTRLYVYRWKHPSIARKHASVSELRYLPDLVLKKTKKIHPGISSFVHDATSVGPDHLQSLVDVALDEVPFAKVNRTPVFLMATAGVRLLSASEQAMLLRNVCTFLKTSTRFRLVDCQSHVQVISGETEGLYGWIATNYLLGSLDRREEHVHGKGHHTYGFLDMGGASAQIAFAPNETEAEKHADDLKLIRMRRLDGRSLDYKVFTATWLGFGANKARVRYVQQLRDSYDDFVDEIPDPCLPRGLRSTLSGEPLPKQRKRSNPILVGTGSFGECLRKTYPLLRKDVPCKDQPCLVNGQHVPAIDFDVNHFVGVSEFWHTTHGVFGKGRSAYDLATYQKVVMDFCNRDWSSIKSELGRRKKSREQRVQDAREACFKASWLINMLHDGIGIPRVSLESFPDMGPNRSKEAPGQSNNFKGILDPFRPVDQINGFDVSWTLGKMILYACGQIPAEETSLPVGFGSNVESGLPSDFEQAGSTPLSPATLEDDNNDDDPRAFMPSLPLSGLLALLLLLLLAAYLLRGADRRRCISNIIRRWRPRASRKGNRSGFASLGRLFRGQSTAYERLFEEEAAGLELGRVDCDEFDYSDSTESPRLGRASKFAGTNLNSDRPGSSQPSSAMDRHGLAVRTESRERFTPSIQMLNAGRRSRGGSPVRSKSPFVFSVGEL